MVEDPEFFTIIKFIKRCLRIMGFNILHDDWKPNIWSICHTIFLLLMLYTSVALLFETKDMIVITEDLSIFGTKTQTFLKTASFVLYQKDLRSLFRTATKQRRHFLACKNESRVIQQYTIDTLKFLKVGLVIYLASFVIYIFFPMVHEDPHKLPMADHLPIVSHRKSPYYEINYLFQVYMGVVIVAYLLAMDGTTILMILHGCCMIDVLIDMLQQLNELIETEYHETRKLKKSERRVFIYLREIQRVHAETKLFMHTSEKIFAISNLILFLADTLLMCMALNVIAINPINSSYQFVIGTVMQLFVYCYCGNKLWIKSDEFYIAIFSVNWYLMDLEDRKNLILILASAKKPLTLTAMFAPLNLETFLQLMKTSYSYFAMLRSQRT